MGPLVFEWDQRKSALNKKKHGVSFDEARTVFLDPSARMIADPDHSAEEDRFVMLGISEALRLLVVCHCYRAKYSVIRIVSARKATKREAFAYKGD